jgi:hypothetical protein
MSISQWESHFQWSETLSDLWVSRENAQEFVAQTSSFRKAGEGGKGRGRKRK